MKVPQMIAAELRRLVSTPVAVVALIALLCARALRRPVPVGEPGPVRAPVALVVDDDGVDLAGAGAGAGIGAAIGVTRMTHFRTLGDLRPSLIG